MISARAPRLLASLAGGRTEQFEVPADGPRSQVRSLGVKPGHVYVVSTQACTRQSLGPSQCLRQYDTRFTAPKA